MPDEGHRADKGGKEREIRVIVVDDSEPFVRSARRHLDLEPGITVAGTASDGESAVRMAGRLKPDLVLLDMSMPRLNGIDTARLLKGLDSPPRVVLMTGHDTEAYRDAARRAGVDAILGKWSLADEAPALIRELCAERASPSGSGS